MRIHANGGGHNHSLDDIRGAARRAADDGLAGFWLSQIFGPDALTALAVIGTEVPDIELGVSVVPVYGRHPLVLAMQALTTQAACGGRLVLGIGPSHQLPVEFLYGDTYARPYTRTVEYLHALRSLLAGEAADVQGEEVRVRGRVEIDAAPPPILIAALGPRMLDLAGSEADGTTLWMVGPNTIGDRIAPRITAAASAAGRTQPRVLAGVNICVTDDADAARAHAAQQLALYGTLPAYRAMLDAEGVAGPEDLLIAGDEDAVAEGLLAYARAGATDVRVSVVTGSDTDAVRTRALLRTLAHNA
jgi:5,10-methylenetetrahydromethanopterin reductase